MPDNLIRQWKKDRTGQTWYVRLAVPKDVQHIIGKSVFKQSLETTSRAVAMQRRLAPLAIWKAQIGVARHGEPVETLPDGLIGEVVRGNITSAVQIAETIRTLRGLHIKGTESLVAEHEQELDELIDNSGYPFPHELHKAITANPQQFKIIGNPLTDERIGQFRKHLDSHSSENEKTKDSHISRLRVIREFLKSSGLPLDYDSMHTFIVDKLSATGTRKQYLWSGSTFYKWAVKYDADFKSRYKDGKNPFTEHDLPKNQASQKKSYKEFSRQEVEQLYSAAKATDIDLANLIAIGAYTGCRLEEIGRLKASDFTFKNSLPYSAEIDKAKTDAGHRQIPIHPHLATLISGLIANKDKDGYLFKGGDNKYGNRLDYLSKRFGRLKSKQGFSGSYVFHSIRKTTATQLHQAGVSPVVIPYILGHEVGHIAFDTYSGGPSMNQKMQAIQQIAFTF